MAGNGTASITSGAVQRNLNRLGDEQDAIKKQLRAMLRRMKRLERENQQLRARVAVLEGKPNSPPNSSRPSSSLTIDDTTTSSKQAGPAPRSTTKRKANEAPSDNDNDNPSRKRKRECVDITQPEAPATKVARVSEPAEKSALDAPTPAEKPASRPAAPRKPSAAANRNSGFVQPKPLKIRKGPAPPPSHPRPANLPSGAVWDGARGRAYLFED